MYIKKISRQERDAQVRFLVELNIAGEEKVLWFETEKENASYFSVDRIDGIAVMLLPEMLLKGETVVSDYPISEKLLYTIMKYLVPILVKQSKGRFSPIDIRCPVTKECYESSIKNATGMSFGIDSMYTYYSHTKKMGYGDGYAVNLLTFYNHGALNGQYTYDQGKMREAFYSGRKKAKYFAEREDIDFLSVDTNLDEICTSNYTVSHTFRTVGISLLFQKLIKNYYYASGYGCEDFCVDPMGDSAYYDLFSLPMLGTECTAFYSDGMDKTRFEKTEYVTQFEETRELLSVCWKDLDNCGNCPKCIRTMAAMELIGNLDLFKDIFNIEKYKSNYIWNWAKIVSLKKTDIYYAEIVREAKTRNKCFDLKIRMLSEIFVMARAIVNPSLLNKLQRIAKK